jgi:hypothetical protein
MVTKPGHWLVTEFLWKVGRAFKVIGYSALVVQLVLLVLLVVGWVLHQKQKILLGDIVSIRASRIGR